ncbi:uncharacterized protein LOC124113621 [Haliotis rufescens]|uniref:uncharacterized protein LOC124113621 n=1 Tax=Haliotis rufescens TaxID=6454 RepID=UPI00201EBC50|nr:uncharacterized protein LOC124113621 [Haliotis rufescens]
MTVCGFYLLTFLAVLGYRMSNAASTTTGTITPSPTAGRVTNLKSFDNTSRSVAVEWSRPHQPNGNIFEYIVDVRTDLRCVKRVIINCTGCSRNRTMPQMQMECTTTMTVVISQTDIENIAHVIQHNLTGLNPDIVYKIEVVAVNDEGPGTPDKVYLHTPEEAAGDPTNFTAQSKSSSEITLKWDPPQPRPGVTQYNLTVYEKQEEGEGYDTLRTIYFSDWATKTYTIGNLSSYWSYKFDIVAETVIGASAIVSSSPERTMESEPTVSTNFQITKLPNVFNMVRVSWKCPKQKDGRNGGIVSANLNYFTTQPAAYVEPVRKNINLSAGGTDCMWDETVTVTTEFLYEFLVRLYNNGFAGAIVNASFYIQGGPPLQTAVTNSVKERTEKSETPSLLICPRCLHDRTNGQVNNTGLIVCRKDNCGHARNRRQATTVVDYDNMANWNEANAQDFDITYRATKKDWLDGNIRKSSLIFTLGNEDCSGNTKNSFCNGKLPTGETFIVFAFSCTNYGCTTSNRIEISTPAQVPVAVVVGGVVAVVVVMLVVIGIFIILRRKNAQREKPNKNRDQVIANFRPELYHIYDEIPDARMVTVHSSRSHEGHVNYVSGQSSRDRYNTYDQLATYPNADSHEYRRINIETRFK